MAKVKIYTYIIYTRKCTNKFARQLNSNSFVKQITIVTLPYHYFKEFLTCTCMYINCIMHCILTSAPAMQ